MKTKYLYGFHPCLEAIRSGHPIERVFLKKGLNGELFQEVFHLIRKQGIPYQFVPVEKLNRITGKNHQGLIAVEALIEYQPLEEVVARVFESGNDPLILLLDGITDVRNLGAIARSAEAAGVNALVLPEKGSAAINADALRTSSGALYMLPVCRTPDLLQTVRYLKTSGIKIFGASEKANSLHYQADLTGPLALVMGAEDTGISYGIIKELDQQIRIPLAGKMESLNVSVAAGVLLFEILRQRNA